MTVDWRTTAWIGCQKGGVVQFPPPPPSLGHHPTLGGVCKAAGPSGEPLHAIEKGALSGESSSLGAWLGILHENCILAPTGPHGWPGASVRILATQFLTAVLSSKDSLLWLQPTDPNRGPGKPWVF